MQLKQILERAFGIQKKIWGNMQFFIQFWEEITYIKCMLFLL